MVSVFSHYDFPKVGPYVPDAYEDTRIFPAFRRKLEYSIATKWVITQHPGILNFIFFFIVVP